MIADEIPRCRVQKLFPSSRPSDEVTKLDDRKIRFLCQHIVRVGDWTVGQIAVQFGVTERRVRQLVKRYRDGGEVPVLSRKRRPKGRPLTQEERALIDTIWLEKRLGARLLHKELLRRGHSIPRHKIHTYLVGTRRSVPNPNKQKKRKRCRYEREHSFSLVHGDWHRTTDDHPHVIVWLDDASRYVLAGREYPERNMDHSVETFQEAEFSAMAFNSAIREVNTDRGAEFFTNHPGSITRFQHYLLDRGIRFIPSRRSNPQTNGKLERFWLEYDRHRWRFPDVGSFIAWYNDRLHGALWVDIGECPREAVIRKMQPESLLGMFMGWSR